MKNDANSDLRFVPAREQRKTAYQSKIKQPSSGFEALSSRLRDTQSLTAPTAFTPPLHLPNYQKQWILTVEKFISEQANNSNLVVADIANALGMSERQLYRRIKQILGITPNAFIQCIRMEIAKRHLENGEFATVAEVSFAVGYSRPDYFSNLFAKRYEQRPIEFIRQH